MVRTRGKREIRRASKEIFLREQLGAEAYDAYRHRVPMLVPPVCLFRTRGK